MTIQLLAAQTIDPGANAAGTPPILDIAHTAHASTTLLYVVLAAHTGIDASLVPTSISATWNGVALNGHLNNFSPNIGRAVAWTGWLRAPATGTRTLRFTFDKTGRGFSCTIYNLSGVKASGNPFGAASQFRDETTRAAGTPSSLSITPDEAGQSLVITTMHLAGNGTMTYTAAGFTTVATGEYGIVGADTNGRSQQTHRYLLNASGAVTVSQVAAAQVRRHGILLVELLPAATSSGGSLDEAVGIDALVDRQLVAGRGLSEAVGIGVTQSGSIQGTGDPQRPAAVWSGAAAVYDTAQAKEIRSGRALTVTGVGPTVLSNGRPAGSFPNNQTSLVEKAPANLGLSAFTVEGWLEAAARGRVLRLAAPNSSMSKLSIQISDSSGGATDCWVLTRTTASGATRSIRKMPLKLRSMGSHARRSVTVASANTPPVMKTNSTA